MCRALSCPHPSRPCPLQSAVPWRPRSGHCGGLPGEAHPPTLPPGTHWALPSPTLPLSCRMKSLEQDALRAQMVLSKSQEGRSKRGPLERLAEAPSPAPTPSPTPWEGPCVQGEAWGSACSEDLAQHPFLVPPDLSPQTSTSLGHLVRSSGCCPPAVPNPRGVGAGTQTAPPPLTLLALCLSPLPLSLQGLVWEEV